MGAEGTDRTCIFSTFMALRSDQGMSRAGLTGSLSRPLLGPELAIPTTT